MSKCTNVDITKKPEINLHLCRQSDLQIGGKTNNFPYPLLVHKVKVATNCCVTECIFFTQSQKFITKIRQILKKIIGETYPDLRSGMYQ